MRMIRAGGGGGLSFNINSPLEFFIKVDNCINNPSDFFSDKKQKQIFF